MVHTTRIAAIRPSWTVGRIENSHRTPDPLLSRRKCRDANAGAEESSARRTNTAGNSLAQSGATRKRNAAVQSRSSKRHTAADCSGSERNIDAGGVGKTYMADQCSIGNT